ncbi:MAG: S-methyl-5-thioribose-1-phosphate isomerase [Gammaproteobacteria bacterium]|nr:S-methyl-5-thioribose-1-phosphate isomerase [Gammaproteobacteria bacterium]NIR96559.1 S-methyl-5-thioribose-1-phosphate isomerase [Gammaproteobacteria bacterium]NIT62297.1 S-methyl-5-thioribose-1-phosphate isomerase [Gammaproteobacteria bacterium]NIV19201.1 S-methyl-5-thioribose-1-phosphate isomerase [Gammaproteobacteria bacterium]NIX10069.1 S-methyl-5-thioribose-1-phosphate isomerase [Gammaproteobacteria bacterium]
MESPPHDTIRAVRWEEGALVLLDQRQLPQRQEYLRLEEAAGVAAAIRDMVVRGAPAIGIAAAYGVVVAARARCAQSGADWKGLIEQDLALLAGARPTAVNLTWALERMGRAIEHARGDPVLALLAEAETIHAEDMAANRRMGALGADLIEAPCAVLTHCNAGSLATGGYGTALGVIRSAFAQGQIEHVYADETRPWLQGARLTAWELVQDGIPVSVVADAAAAYLMQQGRVRWVIVGADRIAANGDVANKIGTYGLAVTARHHGVGFMVVAPSSTVDMRLASGTDIPIETREPGELLGCAGRPVAAPGAEAWNPVFDVTPAALIDALVTERGLVTLPTREKMAQMMVEV